MLSLSGIGASVASGMRPLPVLPYYKRQRSTLERFLKHGLFITFCVALGLIYGFLYTLFPPQLLVYLFVPILILSLIVIWVLPDTERGPTRLMKGLLVAYFLAVVLWPNYLAIALPGLPWVTLRRLLCFPLVGVLLICCSTSSRFRAELSASLRAIKPVTWAIVGFTLIQLVTIFTSPAPAFAFNNSLNHWFQVTAIFFAGAWVMTQERWRRQFITFLVWMTVFLCVVAVLEYRNGAVLWAGRIPSFLQVQSEAMLRYLTAEVRDQQYRVVTTFSVSLSFAEYLAFVTPFVIHRLMKSASIFRIAAWGLLDLALLGVITLTQSRLGIVGWLTAHAVYGCVWSFRRWRDNRSDIIAPAVSLLYPTGAFLFFIGMFTVPAIRNRTIGGGSTGLSDSARQEQFQIMWPKVFDNPFGYGSGSSGEVLGYVTPSGQLTVDSYVITLLLDYGVLGFALFAFALLFAAWKMFRIAWESKTDELELALPLACVLVIAIQIRLVLAQTDNLPIIFLFVAMAAALARRADQLRPVPGTAHATGHQLRPA